MDKNKLDEAKRKISQDATQFQKTLKTMIQSLRSLVKSVPDNLLPEPDINEAMQEFLNNLPNEEIKQEYIRKLARAQAMGIVPDWARNHPYLIDTKEEYAKYQEQIKERHRIEQTRLDLLTDLPSAVAQGGQGR